MRRKDWIGLEIMVVLILAIIGELHWAFYLAAASFVVANRLVAWYRTGSVLGQPPDVEGQH